MHSKIYFKGFAAAVIAAALATGATVAGAGEDLPPPKTQPAIRTREEMPKRRKNARAAMVLLF